MRYKVSSQWYADTHSLEDAHKYKIVEVSGNECKLEWASGSGSHSWHHEASIGDPCDPPEGVGGPCLPQATLDKISALETQIEQLKENFEIELSGVIFKWSPDRRYLDIGQHLAFPRCEIPDLIKWLQFHEAKCES